MALLGTCLPSTERYIESRRSCPDFWVITSQIVILLWICLNNSHTMNFSWETNSLALTLTIFATDIQFLSFQLEHHRSFSWLLLSFSFALRNLCLSPKFFQLIPYCFQDITHCPSSLQCVYFWRLGACRGHLKKFSSILIFPRAWQMMPHYIFWVGGYLLLGHTGLWSQKL